jgi:hypothetical protein
MGFLQIIFSTNMLKGLVHEQVSLGQGPRGARNNNGYSRALFNVWFVKKKKFPKGKKKKKNSKNSKNSK